MLSIREFQNELPGTTGPETVGSDLFFALSEWSQIYPNPLTENEASRKPLAKGSICFHVAREPGRSA